MIIGTVKEIKTGENRVGLTPAGVGVLVKNGHAVLVEAAAGKNSGSRIIGIAPKPRYVIYLAYGY